MRPRLVVVLLVSLCASCRTYAPAPAASPPQGAPVRVMLTDQGTVDMASQVGPGVVSIAGNFLGRDSSSVDIGAITVTKRDGTDDLWKGERVHVPNSDVANFQMGHVSWSRTGLVAAGALAIAIGVATAFGAAGVFGGGKGTGGHPQ